MFGIFSSINLLLRIGPREYVRIKYKLPLVKFIHDTVNLYKSRTKARVNNVREILFRGTVIALITALMVWLSIFMYIAFYHVYVPTISHERPVFLKFKPCGATDDCISKKGICSFPSAHIQLTKKQQLLMSGQPYKIHLELDMPESPANRELGMFMVCVEFMGKEGHLLASSCRSSMLHYKSFLLDTVYKLVFSPFFVFGSSEEKQQVHIELFSNYEEDQLEPVTNIHIEIQTRHIEIYSARFAVNAQFSGLRYVMFHWPVVSAALGITANLFFIAIVCMISWYQILNSEEYLEFLETSKKKLIDNDYFWIYLEETVPLLNISTLVLMPLFMVCDVFSYFKIKIVNCVWTPPRLVLNVVKSGYDEYVETLESVKMMETSKKCFVDNDELECKNIKCQRCKKIVCAKHKKSGCSECLANNKLVFLT